MYNSGDAAEQVVRISLEGTEVALKLTGSAAKNIAAMLYAVWKNRDKNKTKGHQRLSAMLKSGKELKVFTVSEEHLKQYHLLPQCGKLFGKCVDLRFDLRRLFGIGLHRRRPL